MPRKRGGGHFKGRKPAGPLYGHGRAIAGQAAKSARHYRRRLTAGTKSNGAAGRSCIRHTAAS